MAGIVGYSGIVTSWGAGGSVNDRLINAGAKPASYTLTMSGDEFDSTIMASSLLATSKLKGFRSWTVAMESLRPTPITGHEASITYSSGYVAGVQTYDISFTAQAFDSTSMGGSGTSTRWKQFLPGIWSVAGSYTALVDDTTSITEVGNASDPSTITLTVSTGLSFAVSAFTTGGTVSVNPQGLATVQYNFVGSGNVTVTGSTLPFASGSSIAIPVASSLVLTAASGKTYTGSAFPTSVRMQAPVSGQVTTSVMAQGSGALTIA